MPSKTDFSLFKKNFNHKINEHKYIKPISSDFNYNFTKNDIIHTNSQNLFLNKDFQKHKEISNDYMNTFYKQGSSDSNSFKSIL